MSLKSGHKIIPVTGREQEQQLKDFRGNGVGMIRLQPDGWFLSSPFISFGDKYFNFKFKPNDVVVMTYPKCGTTWTQEIVWTLLNNPNLNNPAAAMPVNIRCPFLEFDFIIRQMDMPILEPGHEIYDMFTNTHPDRNPEDGILLQCAELAPEPRIIKTHLPFSLLPPNLLFTCKVIYMVRNPKDIAVSYHHHSRLFTGHGFVGSMDSFVNHFVNDTLLFSPFWTHIKEGWNKREHPNLHFCFYEDVKENPKAEISRLQDFLGAKLTDKQLDNVVQYTSFSAMKARDNVISNLTEEDSSKQSFVNMEVVKSDGGFFRKGIAGDWKNKLTEEQAQKIDEWTKKNVEILGPEFKYFKD